MRQQSDHTEVSGWGHYMVSLCWTVNNNGRKKYYVRWEFLSW